MNTLPKPHDLPKKPLVEAIFEVRWALQKRGPLESEVDPGFQILFGRFYDKISVDFPELEDLPAAQIPEHLIPNVARHRFRKKHNGWPLIQLGPGLLTVNDTEDYTWKIYQRLLQQGVSALFDAYPRNIAPLVLSQISLRYLDAIPLNTMGEGKNILSFLDDHLHTKVSVDPLIFENPQASQEPMGLQLRLNYSLPGLRGTGSIALSTGLKDDIPSVILDMSVVSQGSDVPNNIHALTEWFERAHEFTDHWFFTLCRGGLIEVFGGNNNHA